MNIFPQKAWWVMSRSIRKVLESPAFWVGVVAALGQVVVAVIGRL
jgi:hypothetical protein